MFRKALGNNAYLALLEHRHAHDMFSLIDTNRDHLRQWLPWVDATATPRESKLWIKEALKLYAEGRELHAGIWVETDMAGIIGCRFQWQNHAAVIGYWLGQEYQGMGLMTDACKALLHYCYTALGLNRVEIRCAVENRRSRAIPQRLGFKEEGTVREAEWLYDHYVDHVIYGLLAREWMQGICPDTLKQ